jgi:hypothetical protein
MLGDKEAARKPLKDLAKRFDRMNKVAERLVARATEQKTELLNGSAVVKKEETKT